MKKILLLIAAMLISISASAQLVAPSDVTTNTCTVTYPINAVAVNLPKGYVASVKCEYVTKGALITRFDMEYSAIGTDHKINSVEVAVSRFKQGKAGLTGTAKDRTERKITRVYFSPDEEQKHYRASLIIGDESNWDKILIELNPTSADIIPKSQNKPMPLIKE